MQSSMRMIRGGGPLALVLLVVGLLGACDKDSTGPVQDYARVGGVYHLSALTFDPHGSLPKTDILARLVPADRPELVLSRTDNTFQSITRDPVSGSFMEARGTYTILDDRVRVEFKRAADAQRILLPQRVEFDFDESAMTLSYHANTAVSLDRLRELVPEFRTEQLPDPVLGELVLVYTLDRK